MPIRKNSSVLSFGILGLGRHASRVMLPVFEESLSTVLKAAAPIEPNSPVKLTEQCIAFESMQELLDDSAVEAVYIALPNNLHAEWVIKALQANKHVLCEKPLCLSLAEAKQIHSLAQPKDLQLVEAFMYRHHPQHRIIKELLANGAVGDIQALEIHYHYFLDSPSDSRLKAECGGGALLDVGCYGIDAARFLLEEEPSRTRATSKISKKFGVDECTTLQLQFPSGICASIVSGCRMARQNSYYVYGTLGTLKAHDAFHCPRTKAPRIELISINGKSKRIEASPANQFALQLEAFANLIQGKEVDKHLFGSGLENMRIIEAARTSASS
jgi:predicted dehydrogenase